SQGWYQINYNGKTGWIWGELIEAIPIGKYVTLKNAYQLNIRSNPSFSGSIMGVLSQNQYAEVVGYSADGEWLKISINGVEGWSGKRYLSYIY
ncbi:MAG: SH3 domain-containing protein, partial [Lutispora sp.]|nr:SH3 domain-containing protein [Lutispora sp.]